MSESAIETSQKTSTKSLFFLGKGSAYFGIWIVNVVLTVFTLGLYYPWAVASVRKYFWSQTELENNRFVFHGTGKEIFKGFIVAYLIVIFIYGIQFYGNISQNVTLTLIGSSLVFLALFFLVPIAIFGAIRYRLSRTSWRGIFFSFKGNLRDFINLYLINTLFTTITFGFYYPFMENNLRKYIFSHAKFGNLRFGFDGRGLEYFKIIFLGIFLTFITFGIYYPWYVKNIFNFHINYMFIVDENGEKKYLKSTLSGGKTFGVLFTNLLLAVVTLGFGFAWVLIRNMKLFLNSIQMPEDIDFSTVFQEADDYKNATGDDLADVLDIGIDF